MNELLGKLAAGWIRHFISGLGGYLVAHGYLTSGQSDQAIGALMILVPIALSGIEKYEAQQAKNNAILAAAATAQRGN